jgi:hypothetical protein
MIGRTNTYSSNDIIVSIASGTAKNDALAKRLQRQIQAPFRTTSELPTPCQRSITSSVHVQLSSPLLVPGHRRGGAAS